jgi:hypothetical protein
MKFLKTLVRLVSPTIGALRVSVPIKPPRAMINP